MPTIYYRQEDCLSLLNLLQKRHPGLHLAKSTVDNCISTLLGHQQQSANRYEKRCSAFYTFPAISTSDVLLISDAMRLLLCVSHHHPTTNSSICIQFSVNKPLWEYDKKCVCLVFFFVAVVCATVDYLKIAFNSTHLKNRLTSSVYCPPFFSYRNFEYQLLLDFPSYDLDQQHVSLLNTSADLGIALLKKKNLETTT